MRNKILTIVISTVVIGVLTIFIYGADKDVDKKEVKAKKIEVKEISHKLQFFTSITDTDILKEFLPRKGHPTYFSPIPSGIFWPDEKTINQKKMNLTEDFAPKHLTGGELVSEIESLHAWVSVKDAIKSTEYGINAVIKSEWIPDDITKRMLPLKESYLGDIIKPREVDSDYGVLCDAIWLRYEVKDKYYIQIVSVSNELEIFIKLCKQDKKQFDDEESIKKSVRNMAKELLTEFDETKESSFRCKRGKRGIGWNSDTGLFLKINRYDLNWPEMRHFTEWNWDGGVDWWTDGEVIMLRVAKNNAEYIYKHWFSSPIESKNNNDNDKDKKDDSSHDKDKDKEHKDKDGKDGKDDKSGQPERKESPQPPVRDK